MFDERTLEMAYDAIELHNNPRSHMIFRLDLERSISQIVDEQDPLDALTIGEVVSYRDNLISQVTSAVEHIQNKE